MASNRAVRLHIFGVEHEVNNLKDVEQVKNIM